MNGIILPARFHLSGILKHSLGTSVGTTMSSSDVCSTGIFSLVVSLVVWSSLCSSSVSLLLMLLTCLPLSALKWDELREIWWPLRFAVIMLPLTVSTLYG